MRANFIFKPTPRARTPRAPLRLLNELCVELGVTHLSLVATMRSHSDAPKPVFTHGEKRFFNPVEVKTWWNNRLKTSHNRKECSM